MQVEDNNEACFEVLLPCTGVWRRDPFDNLSVLFKMHKNNGQGLFKVKIHLSSRP